MKRFEIAGLPKKPVQISPEMRDLLKRRTMPFLDNVGVDRPLSFVLEEVYLQGMRDAVQAMKNIPE